MLPNKFALVILLSIFVSVSNQAFSEQEIIKGKCNVQIQGDNNQVDLTNCGKDGQAQKLRALFEQVLNEARISLFRGEEFMFPALERFKKNPTEENWHNVVWIAQQNTDQIQKAVELSFQYDATIANSSAAAIAEVKEAARSANTPFFNSFTELRREWQNRAFGKQKITRAVTVHKRIPTVAQAQKWVNEQRAHYISIQEQLNGIIRLLAIAEEE